VKRDNSSIGKWISTIHRHMHIYIFKELQPYNIGKGQFIFLMTLIKKDGINQEELSEILHFDKGTTAKALKKLEREGYIERKQDPNDKRAYRVYITEKTLAVKPVLDKIKKNLTEIMASDFTKEEKEMTLVLLKRMAENISQFTKDSHC